MTLTRPMRDTLEQAIRQELRRVHDTQPGRPAWPAHPSTLAALVRHGLLAYGTRKSKRGHQLDTWTVTQAGRDALKPREVFRSEALLYCSTMVVPGKRGSYTPMRHQASDKLPITDTEAIERWRFEEAEARRLAAQERRVAAGRAVRALRAAA
jgi:hypothetical protein